MQILNICDTLKIHFSQNTNECGNLPIKSKSNEEAGIAAIVGGLIISAFLGKSIAMTWLEKVEQVII